VRPFRLRFTLANTTRQYESLLAHRVGESFVVGHLADAHGLCGNAEACAVHEGHHVLDQTELAAAAEFSLRVLLYRRGKCPPRFSPGPALIIVPFGNTIKTHPSQVLRYPF